MTFHTLPLPSSLIARPGSALGKMDLRGHSIKDTGHSPRHWTFSRTHRDSDDPGHSFPTTVHEILLWTVFVASKLMLKS